MEPILFFSALYLLILAGGISLGVLQAKGPLLAFAQTGDTIQPGVSGNMTNQERQAQADAQAVPDQIQEGVSGNKTNQENNAPIPGSPDPLDDVPQQIPQEEIPDQAPEGSEPYDASTGRPVISEPIPYTYPDFSDRSDFRADTLPTENIIDYQSAYLNPGEVGELRFLIEPDWVAILRVVPQGRELNLNGFENAFQEQVRHVQTDGKDVLLFNNPNGAALALWSKNGFDYALYFERTEMGLFTGSADLFIEQTNFIKTE